MIKNIEELKSLILWAKDQKIKTLEVAGISVQFSDLAFIGEYEDLLTKNPTNTTVISPGAHEPHDLAASKAEDDELLFYSANQ